jgi:hypothetical protein
MWWPSPASASSSRPSATPEHGEWLAQNLPSARLVLREGEGHFGPFEHLGQMLDALTEPVPAPDNSGTIGPLIQILFHQNEPWYPSRATLRLPAWRQETPPGRVVNSRSRQYA